MREKKCERSKNKIETMDREREKSARSLTTQHTHKWDKQKRNVYTYIKKKICFVILILTCDYDYDDLMKIFGATKHLLAVWCGDGVYGLVSVIE